MSGRVTRQLLRFICQLRSALLPPSAEWLIAAPDRPVVCRLHRLPINWLSYSHADAAVEVECSFAGAHGDAAEELMQRRLCAPLSLLPPPSRSSRRSSSLPSSLCSYSASSRYGWLRALAAAQEWWQRWSAAPGNGGTAAAASAAALGCSAPAVPHPADAAPTAFPWLPSTCASAA